MHKGLLWCCGLMQLKVATLNLIMTVTKKRFLMLIGGLVTSGRPNRVSIGANIDIFHWYIPIHSLESIRKYEVLQWRTYSVLPELLNNLCMSFNKTHINNYWIFKFSGLFSHKPKPIV